MRALLAVALILVSCGSPQPPKQRLLVEQGFCGPDGAIARVTAHTIALIACASDACRARADALYAQGEAAALAYCPPITAPPPAYGNKIVDAGDAGAP